MCVVQLINHCCLSVYEGQLILDQRQVAEIAPRIYWPWPNHLLFHKFWKYHLNDNYLTKCNIHTYVILTALRRVYIKLHSILDSVSYLSVKLLGTLKLLLVVVGLPSYLQECL